MASNESAAGKAAAAKKAAQAQVRAQQRRSTVVWVAVALAILTAFAALVAFIMNQAAVSTPDGEKQFVPQVATEDGAFAFGTSDIPGQDLDDSKVRLDIYFDFMCPVCGYFEQINEPDIAAMREEGLVEVYYHPIAILDYLSAGTNYSTRAASAAALVAEEAPDKYLAFVGELFANQPAEKSRGLNDAQLRELATKAGVPDDVVAKISDYSYANWVTASTEQASIAGVHGTPTIVIDGEVMNEEGGQSLDWTVEGQLRVAILEAASN